MKRVAKSTVAVLLCTAMLGTTGVETFAMPVVNSDLDLENLTVEHSTAPLGIDVENPIFGWSMQSNYVGAKQTAYQILVTDENGEVVWDSGKVEDENSSAIAYAGKELEAETAYTWKVTVWDQNGTEIENTSTFTTGVKGNWDGAKWITPVLDEQTDDCAPMLRTEKEVKGDIKKATLYMTALGNYTAYINGQQVQYRDDYVDVLNPGWTDYFERVRYQTYDVTDLIDGDEVALGVWLSNGWYNGALFGSADACDTLVGEEDRSELCLMGKLVMEYMDGEKEIIVTDPDEWKCSDEGPISVNNIYTGETYDANLKSAVENWDEPGFDDSSWNQVSLIEYESDVVSNNGEAYAYLDPDENKTPVNGEDSFIYSEVNESVENGGTSEYDLGEVVRQPVDVNGDIELNPGETLILDMGQNMVGVTSLDITGEQGTTVQVRHGEMLNDGQTSEIPTGGSDGPRGSLYRENLNANAGGWAQQTLVYTLDDSGRQTYMPQFTFMGYQYVEITTTAPITIHQVVGHVISSAIDQTGSFSTNNEDVNQLYSNIIWGNRGNFLSIPTDCPQRGERAGWTGDAQLFAESALYNFDCVAFYNNYMDNLNDNQQKYGLGYGSIAPEISGVGADIIAGWSDAGVSIPWRLYLASGDISVLENNYPYMDAYMDAVQENGYKLDSWGGDWVAIQGGSIGCISALYEIYMTEIMRDTSQLLGMNDKVQKYEERDEKLRSEFFSTWMDENGNVLSGAEASGMSGPAIDNAQTPLLWALKLKLYRSDEERDTMLNNLLANIRNENQEFRDYPENTLAVGFLGVDVLLPVLTDYGYADVAYELLLQEEQPSWLFEVKNGATTVWERWDGYSYENSFNSSGMNSFNHFSYGACVEWMYEYVLGIQKDEEAAGFKHFVLQPTVDEAGKITTASGSYDSVYGTIYSGWEEDGNGNMASYETAVPANTTATLYLPVEAADTVLNTAGVEFLGNEIHNGKNCAKFELTAGGYEFTITDGVITVDLAEGYVA